MKKLRFLYYFLFLIVLSGFIIFKLSNVSKEVTAEDKVYIQKILDKCHLKLTTKPNDFKEEIDQIFMVQDSILKYFPISKKLIGIPLNHEREPKDLIENKEYLCFDRSRSMEKIFLNLGYKIKHVFIISDTLKQNESFEVFFKKRKGLISHAMFEIKTKKGWVLVGTNERWLSIDDSYNTYDANKLSKIYQSGKTIKFLYPNREFERLYLPFGFKYVYGLYSRHGRFFSPYNSLPDFNYFDALKNINF